MQQVQHWLKSSKNIQAPADWLEACISWIQESFSRQEVSSSLKELVLEQWLVCNLPDIGASCLPPNVTQQNKMTLTGSYALQLNWAVDVSTPYYTQLQKLEGQNTENLNTSESERLPNTQHQGYNNNYHNNNKSNRMLMLELTDGSQVIKAMEYQPIACLNANLPVGTKVLITGPVLCRLGVLQLKPNNISVMGGAAEELEEEFNQLQLLRQLLNTKKNIPPVQRTREGSGNFLNQGQSGQQSVRGVANQQQPRQPPSNQQPTYRPPTNQQQAYRPPSSHQQAYRPPSNQQQPHRQAANQNMGFNHQENSQTRQSSQYVGARENNWTSTTKNIQNDDDALDDFDDDLDDLMMDQVQALETQWGQDDSFEEIADQLDESTNFFSTNTGQNSMSNQSNTQVPSQAGLPTSYSSNNSNSAAYPKQASKLATNERIGRHNITDSKSNSVSSRTSAVPNESARELNLPNKKARISDGFSDDDDFSDIIELNQSLYSRLSARPNTSASNFRAESLQSKPSSTGQHVKRQAAAIITGPTSDRCSNFSSGHEESTKGDASLKQESFTSCSDRALKTSFGSGASSRSSLNPVHTSPNCDKLIEGHPVRTRQEISSKNDMDGLGTDLQEATGCPPVRTAHACDTSVAVVSPMASSHVSPVFTYIAEKSRWAGQSTFVKGYISTLMGHLDCNQGQHWSLKVKVNDGTDCCDMDLSNEVLRRLIGFSALDAAKLKTKDPEMLSKKAQLTQGLKHCQQTLVEISGFFKVYWSQTPMITDWSLPNEKLMQYFST